MDGGRRVCYDVDMSSIVTIPRAVTKRGELVVLPRQEYEHLLRMSIADAGRDTVDADIQEGLRDIETGRTFGPFESVAEFKTAVKQYEAGVFKKSVRRIHRAVSRSSRPRR